MTEFEFGNLITLKIDELSKNQGIGFVIPVFKGGGKDRDIKIVIKKKDEMIPFNQWILQQMIEEKIWQD